MDAPTLKEQYAPTPLQKRAICTLNSGIPIIMGVVDLSVHAYVPVIEFEHQILGKVKAKFVRVTPREVWYAQVKETTP